ncbi:MAG TPA: hypothetical protein VE961_25040, partial [Pyrinomonadaceae bacterium]|nr:hypothetical protein [Pyrinomonadaceae bacterium]
MNHGYTYQTTLAAAFISRSWVKLTLGVLLLTLWALLSASPLTATRASSAIESQPTGLTITVNTTGDGSAFDPNSSCDADAGTPNDQCTLRAAIQRANVVTGNVTIDFDIPLTQPNCDATTGHCTIKLTGLLPDLRPGLTVNGPGKDKLTVRRDTGGDYPIFVVKLDGTVTVQHLRIENGRSNVGGGIINFGAAEVNVIDVVLFGNFAQLSGGAIHNDSSGTLNVTSSELDQNLSLGGGGGIFNAGAGTINVSKTLFYANNASGGDGGGINNNGAGTANISNSTFFQNGAQFIKGTGAGVRNVTGAMNISNCSFVQNLAEANGGGISGPATVKSTLVVRSFSAQFVRSVADVAGNITSAGFNFIGDKGTTTGFNQPTDQTGTASAPLDPRFESFSIPASDFKIEKLVPRCGSPMVDQGSSVGLTETATTDERGDGFPRTIDDPITPNAAGGDGTDIGALERGPCPQFTFVVNTTADTDDVNPGDSVCDSDAAAAGSQCTLRAAMHEAETLTGNQLIRFDIPANDPGFNSVTGTFTINLTRALPDINNTNLTIEGPGWDKLTVQRGVGGFYRIFTFGSFARETTVSGLTISNGLSETDGGAISQVAGTLNVSDCVFTGNFAADTGGAIDSTHDLGLTQKLNVTNSVFSGNAAANAGGAIAFNGG